jgi:hypothetical protein
MASRIDHGPPAAVGPDVSGITVDDLLLPTHPPRYGPVTRRLLVRTAALMGVLFVAGVALATAFESPYARAAGLSLILPGGGFLYDAWPLLFIATAVAMFFAVVLWWGLSALFTIPLVWVGAGALSVALARGPRLFVERDTTWEWAIPVVVLVYVALVAHAVVRSEKRYRSKLAEVTAINAFLRTATLPTPSKPDVEPTELDSELLRWTYDLALQPIDQFEGFDWGEQYHGGTCLRYQLCFLGEALAVCAANLLPNYTQVIEPSMANLIEKMTDLRVWKYWPLENFLARFSRDPDPMVKDNIMLSGFFQTQINMFEAATGSRRFDEPGSLPFVWKDGRVFSYDHAAINEALTRNFTQAEIGLFPCEPTWVFTVCNVMGAQGVTGYDRLHGTDEWGTVERTWRRGVLGEMMTPDGAFRHIRTNVFGFSFNDGDGTGEYLLTASHGFEDVAPDIALRGKLLSLRGVPEKMDKLATLIEDGELDLAVPPKRERSTYIMSALSEWMGIIAGARLAGNEAVAQAAQRRMERECATRRPWPDKPLVAGVQSIAIYLWARWGTPVSLADLARRGYVEPRGPVLDDAPWPDVLVSKARSVDGSSLDLVVEPNRPLSAGEHRFGFRALAPDTAYRLHGAGVDIPLRAGADGRATVALKVAERVALRLETA